MTNDEIYRDLMRQKGMPVDGDEQIYEDKRHNGVFSSSNPYYLQLMTAESKADKDYLWELATKWEAKWQATQEQRDYDDPLNQVARQRRAGIDTSLSGQGVSSGSSAQVDPVQNTVQPKNVYGDAQVATGAISAVTSMIGSSSQLMTSIFGGIDLMKTLPARVKLGDAQAFVADATKDTLIESAGQSLEALKLGNAGQTLANTAQSLGNFSSSLNLMHDLSQFITPETSDEESAQILSALGVPNESIPVAQGMVKQWHSNPLYKSTYEANQRKAIEEEEYNKVYTREAIRKHIESGLRLQSFKDAFAEDTAELDANVADFLNTFSNASTIANAELQGNMNDLENANFAYQKLSRNIEAFNRNIGDLAYYSRKLSDEWNVLNEKRRSRGYSTPAERATMESIEHSLYQIDALGSESVHKVYNIGRGVSRTKYLNSVNLNAGGNVEMTPGIQKHQVFTNYTFEDLVNGTVTPDELTGQILNFIPYVGSAAAYVYEQNQPTKK